MKPMGGGVILLALLMAAWVTAFERLSVVTFGAVAVLVLAPFLIPGARILDVIRAGPDAEHRDREPPLPGR